MLEQKWSDILVLFVFVFTCWVLLFVLDFLSFYHLHHLYLLCEIDMLEELCFSLPLSFISELYDLCVFWLTRCELSDCFPKAPFSSLMNSILVGQN